MAVALIDGRPARSFLYCRFATRCGGNVAIIFGFSLLPIIAFAGTVVDYGLATRLKVKLQASTDAAALRLCQMDPVSATLSILQTQAGLLMTGFMGNVTVTTDPLTLSPTPRKILLTTHTNSKTYFGRFTGVVSPVVTASAQCASGGTPQVYEIALALDTTGSMEKSAGTQNKMQAAQQAASDFVDFVFTTPSFATGTKIAIVPFAAAVAVDPVAYRYASWIDKAGTSKYHWTNIEHPGSSFASRFDIFDKMKLTNATWGWAGCLESLAYPQNTQDGYSTSSDNLYVPMFAPDEDGDSTTGSYNSYLDDYTPGGFFGLFPSNCTSYSVNNYGNDAEARSCKYKYPNNPAARLASGTSLANGPNYQCTSKPLQRLTSNIVALKALISSLNPIGSTNIFEGIMWAWRTISPTSVFGDGGSYAGATKKIIVLMTDGANTWNTSTSYNKSNYSSLGYIRNADGSNPNSRLPVTNQNLTDDNSTRIALDSLTALACTNAKAAGVTIYTVAFSTPGDPIDTTGIAMLAACASPTSAQPPGPKAYVANDATALKAAFSSIGTGIGKVRLSQ